MVFEILLRLPAEDIHNRARFVCRKWYDITNSRNFIHEHLRHSTPGLVIQFGAASTKQPITVSSTRRGGRIEVSKFNNHDFKYFYSYGCNGLFLQHYHTINRVLYITNPVTNRHFPLPESVNSALPNTCSVLAYASNSMAYKLVQTYERTDDYIEIVRDCAILTIGVDRSMRHVDTQHLSTASRELLVYVLLTIEGFVHWTKKSKATDHVATLNAETEVITETRVPVDYGLEILRYYLSTGSLLTLLVKCGEYSWEFWNLKSETGEWTKMPDIDLEPQKGKLVVQNPTVTFRSCNLRPVGWLNHGEVLVLHSSDFARVCVMYVVLTHEIDFLELDYKGYNHIFDSHRNSLLSLD